MPSRCGRHRRQRDDGPGGIAHDRPLSTVAAQGPPEWRRTMLDETSDGLRDVIDADMTQPVRRRSTRRRRRRQRNDLDALTHEPADTLTANDIGRARVRLAADLPLERYSANRAGGSFLVIHPSDGATLAAGIVRD